MSPLYERWSKMLWRTRHKYIGVNVDPRWATFQGFVDNQPPGRPYEPGLCLCRYGDEGDYTPENTRWDTRGNNTREAWAGGRIGPPRDIGDEVVEILTAALERLSTRACANGG